MKTNSMPMYPSQKLTPSWAWPHFLTFGWLVLGILALAPHSVVALGFRVPNQDAEATGRGNAFTATANNPSAIYYNPAGITQIEGQTAQAGVHIISVNSEFTSPTGQKSETKFEIQPIPQFYYTYKMQDLPVAFGVGAYVPYGLGLEWEGNTPFRSIGIEGRLTYMTVNPVVAWQVHPTLSLAIGPTLNYSYTRLRQGIGLMSGDQFEFKGDGYDFGFSAGLLWQPLPKWSFGASYFNSTSVEYEGTTRVNTIPALSGAAHTTGTIDFPQFAKFGISYRPTPKWNFEVDADWTDWDVLNTVLFKGTRSIFGADAALPFNWKSSWLYEFGGSYYFDNGYFLSGGYFFSQNSTLDRNFCPIVPDTDLHVGSVGVGYKGQHWTWALSGQIITGPSRTIANSQSTSLIGESANGDYRWFNQAVNASIAYRF